VRTIAVLTVQEAAELLVYESIADMPKKVATILLPAVAGFIQEATGKDWGALTDTYTKIDPLAKLVAGVLLVRWFEDPGMIGKTNDIGVLSMIAQLEAKVLQEKQAGTG
jgi:hypothetical protein